MTDKKKKARTRRRPEFEDTEEAARAAAVRLLARREYARGELEQRLRSRGYGRERVTAVLAELEQDGYLSDARFAEHVVRTRIDRGNGPMKIRAELSRHGVADAEIERALADAECDFAALAAEARERRFGEAGPRDLSDKARQARFLAQRGFRSEDMRDCLDLDPADPGLE